MADARAHFASVFLGIVLFFIPALSFTPAYGGDNLVTNPGFESGTTGWVGSGCTLSISTSVFHQGSKSGYATGRTATSISMI